MTEVQITFDVVVLVVLGALLGGALLVAREIGRVQVRLGPLGARTMSGGPGVGETGPSFTGLLDHGGHEVQIGGRQAHSQLLVFTSPNCSTCLSLMAGVNAMARRERALSVLIVSDGTPSEHARFLEAVQLGDQIRYVDAFEVGMAYEVASTPYGVVLDETGVVRAKGLCNHMQHVESLLNSSETRTQSIQHLHDRSVQASATLSAQ
jgi:methylamine dehydrogenase accessory protein MauD